MRTLYFLIFFSVQIHSQQYILLESLKNDFKVKEYTLKTKDIYSFDEEVKLYNIFVSDKTILLISILPYLNISNLEIKRGNWEKIDFRDIKEKIVTNDKIFHTVFDWSVENNLGKTNFNYKLVRKIGQEYYVAKTTYAQAFMIDVLPKPLIAPIGVLNLSEEKVTIKEMYRAFNTRFPEDKFPLESSSTHQLHNADIKYVMKNYLSKHHIIGNKKAYQFWTLDGNMYSRGIDRFIYVEDMGIVGGSFDPYFANYDTEINIWRNILNENLMIAQELK